MSLESDIFAALSPLFDGARVYAVRFPQEPVRPAFPAARFTFISTAPVDDICGTDDETADVRVQVDVIDETFDGARAKRASVITAMHGLATPTRMAGSRDDFDQDLKLYLCSVDFLVYPSS